MNWGSRGQAFIEALLCLPVSLIGIATLLGGLIYFTHQMLISEWSEDYLLCQLSAEDSTCHQQLQGRLRTLKLYSPQFSVEETSEYLSIQIQMRSHIHGRLHMELLKKISKQPFEKNI
ncbi:hypothetical protein [Pseudobdellovibrio exovorus]|uniref:hypothetical protein n=1 Tax=Pseudobdellovibrio exovorus TaxID=453816 RepID=UPI00034D2B7D|nr:hypothetical protein [Pseudobdellovibrio exovorus]